MARFGRVDILLNGVGGSSIRRPLVEVDAREFAAVVELNLLAGCILPTKQVAQYWIEQGIRGAIINIASMGSYRPLSGGWAYSAAKAAVMNQTVAHARELAPHGIRVNALAPGFFLGKQNRRLLVAEDGTPTARGQAVLAHTPLGRFGRPGRAHRGRGLPRERRRRFRVGRHASRGRRLPLPRDLMGRTSATPDGSSLRRCDE